MIDCDSISERETDDAAGILELSHEAVRFLNSRSWCQRVDKTYFDLGFRHAAVFFCEIAAAPGADSEVWVIVGDLPPAYMDTTCKTGAEALASYCWWLKRWAEAVRGGQSVDDLMPILTRDSYDEVSPSLDYADLLLRRLEFLRTRILADYVDDIPLDLRQGLDL